MSGQQRPDLSNGEADFEGQTPFKSEEPAETDEVQDDVEGHRRHFFKADVKRDETVKGSEGQMS
jgi:hypothetical protein